MFTLVIYQYNEPAVNLYVSGSMLGDAETNACLGAIKVTDKIATRYDLTFAITPPL